MGHVGWVGHAGVEWVMLGWGWGGSCRVDWVGHIGVWWGGS